MRFSERPSTRNRAILSAAWVVAATAGLASEAEPGVHPLSTSWEIELEGNPSTGYRWQLDKAASQGLDRVEVRPLGYKDNASGLVGAPAPFVFNLTCRAAGEAHLVFTYVGPTGVVSDRTHETRVRCK